MGSKRSFANLDDDILIAVFGFLDLHSILALRQTSKRFQAISQLAVVWRCAFTTQVVARGYPYPLEALSPSIDAQTLEKITRRSCRIARFWLDPSTQPCSHQEFRMKTSTGIYEIRILPEEEHEHWGRKRFLTISKGIWSEISCWEVGEGLMPLHKIAEWCPRGAIFTGIAVNSNPHSEGTVAVSLSNGGDQTIQVLSLRVKGDVVGFEVIKSFQTSYKPVYMEGDILVFSDDAVETYVADWRTGEAAVLIGSQASTEHNFQYNKCLKVIFAYESVLVVRARSIELFPVPTLKPSTEDVPVYNSLASHSFGWMDGVAIYPQHQVSSKDARNSASICIVVRSENDDPWSSDIHTVHLYHLEVNASYVSSRRASPELKSINLEMPMNGDSNSAESSPSPPMESPPLAPYDFPPTHLTSFPSIRGRLRCTDILSGDHGTAIWIQPRPAHDVSLTTFDVHSSEAQVPYRVPVSNARETLLGAVFPGVLLSSNGESKGNGVRIIAERERDSDANWTAMDYDEIRGLVVLGSSDGRITLLGL
ncbi:unnamed protein product [Somion occarium]|uniref:F-box domain-containing protein n=1 Tax=Somion occarium TaxID=3059160 RepID=A0ABP1CS96_9APHY